MHRALHERRGHPGIDSARKTEHDASVRDLGPDLADRRVEERGHRPVRGEACDPEQEVGQNIATLLKPITVTHLEDRDAKLIDLRCH